ncbi:MAG: helix-turn-helix transcriptional regulator [Planctomycetota bacterium]|nr:helix-turn-helix transcriptional regulator [Planctomycetota bacterium]
MTDVLKAAIADSGLPLLRLSKATGVQRTSLIRFTRGETSLHLDVADVLADYFGLKLVAEKTSTRKAK